MSAPIQNDADGRVRDTASMYAPPWARDAATDAADAALAATENLRRVLPAAPQLREPEARMRRREPPPFEGDVALRELRVLPAADPLSIPEPRAIRRPGSAISVLMRGSAAVVIAAVAAFFMVSLVPDSQRNPASGLDDAAKPLWSRMFGVNTVREPLTAPKPAEPRLAERKAERVVDPPVPMMERFAAATPTAEPPVTAPPPQTAVPQPAQAAERPAPSAPAAVALPARQIDREEIATLYKRGEQLITQGDIASARLMFQRAAEVGDARSALALGASYDPDVLQKLGVLGVAADATRAREWYAKASSFGSREAAQRIELMAQGR